jgi:hypothetical protein
MTRRKNLRIVPGHSFSLVYSVQGRLEPMGSLAAAASKLP